LAASFAEIEGRGTASNVIQEMTRILTEQGVDEAIAYVATHRPLILKNRSCSRNLSL
jgi:L-amino acid N-acyltransferase YncA